MFKDEEKYKAYLKKQQVSVLDIDAYNFFQHSKSGEIILNDFDLNKAIDDYLSGITLKDLLNRQVEMYSNDYVI